MPNGDTAAICTLLADYADNARGGTAMYSCTLADTARDRSDWAVAVNPNVYDLPNCSRPLGMARDVLLVVDMAFITLVALP